MGPLACSRHPPQHTPMIRGEIRRFFTSARLLTCVSARGRGLAASRAAASGDFLSTGNRSWIGAVVPEHPAAPA